MKQIEGIWLPSADEHFLPHLLASPKRGGKATYQLKKYEAAICHVPKDKRIHAVDIGGHVGLWSRVMAMDFDQVTSYEPLSIHRECFAKNVESENVTLYPYALGSQDQVVGISTPHGNTGSSHVWSLGERVQMRCFDELELDHVDFLKIDVEGYEYEVLLGGEQRIRKDMPVIVIEQKANNAERYGRRQRDASELLKEWGMKEVEVISGDHILVW